MQYALLIYQTAEDFAARTDPVKMEAFWGSFMPYLAAIRGAGIVVAGAGLEPPEMTTTVRKGPNGRLVQDGPFADAKEQLGGFFVIEVPNLDTALDWASRCPTGTVEVRPCTPPKE